MFRNGVELFERGNELVGHGAVLRLKQRHARLRFGRYQERPDTLAVFYLERRGSDDVPVWLFDCRYKGEPLELRFGWDRRLDYMLWSVDHSRFPRLADYQHYQQERWNARVARQRKQLRDGLDDALQAVL